MFSGKVLFFFLQQTHIPNSPHHPFVGEEFVVGKKQ